MQKRRTRARKSIHLADTAGCLEIKEQAWCARLRADLYRAEAYFWAQTEERREIQRRYLLAKHRFGKDSFFFGKSSAAF
jgi:hypothetical protein